LLSTLYSFVSCTFPSRVVVTSLKGRLNLRSPSHRPLSISDDA
jgi:hypothetical protein